MRLWIAAWGDADESTRAATDLYGLPQIWPCKRSAGVLPAPVEDRKLALCHVHGYVSRTHNDRHRGTGMRSRILRVIVIFAIACTAAWAQSGKQALDTALDSLYSVRGFEQVAMSPDGAQVGWVQRLGSGGSGIFVTATKATAEQAKRISAAADEQPREEGHIAWSPDSKRLAFLSDAGSPGQLQLYVSELDGSPTRKLTSLQGFLDAPQWSPDGKTIALLFTENAPRASGPLMPMTPETGVIANKIYEQRLTTVEVASSEVRKISPADMYVYEYDWSPDSKELVVTAAKGAGDANWYVA